MPLTFLYTYAIIFKNQLVYCSFCGSAPRDINKEIIVIELLYPKNGESISILTDVQKDFIERQERGEHTNWETSYNWILENYERHPDVFYIDDPNEANLTMPRYTEFAWKADKPCRLVISRQGGDDYPGDPQEWEIVPAEDRDGVSSATVGNFFARSNYSWKVVAMDGSEESESRDFTTKDEFPRAIYGQGASNIRDIGALERYDGKKLRQGRIYRGTCFDSEIDREYLISERGKVALRDGLKIKTDLDIRQEAYGVLKSSMLGDTVRYHQIVGKGHDEFYLEPEWGQCKALVEFLADENNYPIYCHCMGGADRTGTLIFLISALTGVKTEMMIKDYNITSLTVLGLRCITDVHQFEYSYFDGDWDGVEPIEVAAMRGSKKFLMEKCGVSEETIERLRRNLIEGYEGE